MYGPVDFGVLYTALAHLVWRERHDRRDRLFHGVTPRLVVPALPPEGGTGKFGGGRKCSHQEFNAAAPAEGIRLDLTGDGVYSSNRLRSVAAPSPKMHEGGLLLDSHQRVALVDTRPVQAMVDGVRVGQVSGE